MKGKLLAAVAVALFGVQNVASAAWSQIFTLQPPANGQYTTYMRIKTSRLKVEKVGLGCAQTRINYTAQGRDLNGFPILLNLIAQGQTSSGAMIYNVAPTATIFAFNVQTVAIGNGGCVYNFYAHVIDDNDL